MLRKNFKVGHQVLNNVTKQLYLSIDCNNKGQNNLKAGKFAQSQTNKICLTSVQRKKKFKLCPKCPSFLVCCKKFFFRKPQCKTPTAGDEYLEARRSVKLHFEEMMRFIDDESRTIISNLKNCLDKNKLAHATQLQNLVKKTTCKLDELSSLDVSYGCWMRTKTLLLNDEIRRSFDALERAIVPNMMQIMSRLKELKNDVSMCAERADTNINLCRKYDVPSDLSQCVNERLDEIKLMLEILNNEMRYKLKEIVKSCEKVIKTHELTAREVIESNSQKSIELSNYLENCIKMQKEKYK